MHSYTGVAGWGFLISALGSLPLGALNITAMQVALSGGLVNGIFFSLGVALVEVLYVRISLVGIHWLLRHEALLRVMDWVAVIIVLLLAAGSFNAAMHPSAGKSFILNTRLPFFVLGLLMSALNPVQLPFWLGWSSFLFTRKILKPRADFYNWYTAGIGAGTLAGLAVFVYGGRFLVDVFHARQAFINYALGIVFLITVLLQIIKIMKHRGLAASTGMKAAELEKAGEVQA